MVTATRPQPRRVFDPLRLKVSDVTGRRRFELTQLDGYQPAGRVAMRVAEMMEFPSETRFSLRSAQGRMLVDDEPIGGQVEADSDTELVVIPRAHLG
jgi:hypothetical protein